MKLLLRQRIFSWLDSYDIYDEFKNVKYHVEGKFAFKHLLNVYDAFHNYLGSVRERAFSFLPKFDIYKADMFIGTIKKEFSFFGSIFKMDYCGFSVYGDFFGYNYEIKDMNHHLIARVYKDLFHLSDHYILDIIDSNNELNLLMLVLAIDANKCSRNK